MAISHSAKRRRTSQTEYTTINDQENEALQRTKPTTPKRASYQSPTKASLARTNPKVLQSMAHAKGRRESEPMRRQSLREAVLGNRSLAPLQAEQESLPNGNEEEPREEPKRAVSNVPNNVLMNLKDAPNQELHPLSAEPSQTKNIPIPLPRRRYSPPAATAIIVPKLVESSSSLSRRQREQRSPSTELPPTPVQLGTNPAPERPRGLASSSPGGSGRRRFRSERGTVMSSPLKPRNTNPTPIEVEHEDNAVEIASGIDEPSDEPDATLYTAEVPQTEGLDLDDMNSSTGALNEAITAEADNIDISHKQLRLKELRDELRRLQKDCESIQNVSKVMNANDNASVTPKSLSMVVDMILDNASVPKSFWPPQENDRNHFRKHQNAYLNLFAPGNLRLSYETYEKFVAGNPQFVYQTTLWAPECWPTNTFNITLNTMVDLEDEHIVEIEHVKDGRTPKSLDIWVKSRLDEPVMRCDLATVLTGAANYFEEAVKRANVFKVLDERFGGRAAGDAQTTDAPLFDVATLSKKDAIMLLPFVHQDALLFNREERGQTRKTRHSGAARQLRLVCTISLNWIGQAVAEYDIEYKGFDNKVVEQAWTLFENALATDGIVVAFEAVWLALGMSSTDSGFGDRETGKGKLGKARRMTHFE